MHIGKATQGEEKFSTAVLAVVFGTVACLGKSHAVISSCSPLFLMVALLFSFLFIKSS
jgi:hypothetical protein